MGKVPVVPKLLPSQIEAAADRVLRDCCPGIWQNDLPVPVDSIFEFYIQGKYDIRTGYTELQKLGVNAEGYTNARQRLSIVDKSLSNNYSISGRRRFRSTTGHEIGHCVLHIPLAGRWQESLQIVGMGMKRERSDLNPLEDPEWQAWRFCQALCMPYDIVMKILGQTGADYPGVNRLMTRFDMSYSFVMSRLKSLKLIPRNGWQPITGNRQLPLKGKKRTK